MSNDLVQGFLNATSSKASSKKTYEINEVLGIMAMFQSGLKPQQVAELTGRSVHTLRYKFLEGEIELNGVKTVRSVKRFANIEELFAHYKTPYVDAADVAARIQQWKDGLTATEAAS
jgi:hypothetical protein